MSQRAALSIGCTLAVAALPGLLAAQQVDLKIAPDKDQPLRYTIETKSKVTTERQILIDGEEPQFGGGGRGFGGGGGPVETIAKVVFDEGTSKSGAWRTYHTAEASVRREDPDGAPIEQKIEGALVGKKLFMIEDDRGVVVVEGSADGEEVDPMTSRGIPAAMAIGGLIPSKTVEVGEEFELSGSLPAALKSFAHPVRAARGERAGGRRGGRGEGGEQGGRRGGRGEGGEQGGRRGGRGEGGEQGDRRGGRGEGGFGGRGGRGGFGGGFGGGGGDAALQLLANDKLKLQGTGKVVALDTEGDVQIAKVQLSGKMAGKGEPAKLGLSGTGFGRAGGGRGGRGGFGGGEEEGKAEASVSFEGTVWIDVTNHQLHRLELKGKVESVVDTVRTMREREIESHSETDGEIELRVSVAPAKS